MQEDRQKKKEAKKRTDKKELMSVMFLNIFFLHQLLLASPLLRFILLLSSIYLLAPEEDFSYQKRLCTIIFLHFVALVSTFPWICSILSTSPAVLRSFPESHNQKYLSWMLFLMQISVLQTGLNVDLYWSLLLHDIYHCIFFSKNWLTWSLFLM